MSIREIGLKIKSALDGTVRSGQLLQFLILVLVATGAFGLGRLSTHATSAPVTLFVPQSQEAAVLGSANPGGVASVNVGVDVSGDGRVVASKNGSKYHLPWCSGAQRIAEQNKIWFNSRAEAEAAGYAPAANCKGL